MKHDLNKSLLIESNPLLSFPQSGLHHSRLHVLDPIPHGRHLSVLLTDEDLLLGRVAGGSVGQVLVRGVQPDLGLLEVDLEGLGHLQGALERLLRLRDLRDPDCVVSLQN